MQGLDQSRENLLPKIGATSFTINRAAIETLPQGDNTPIDKLVLQFPGVNYDSAVSNPSFHIRGEYANVQTRINGLVLPEGVSGLGPVIDTNFIGSMSLLTGTLPAQYGLRTAGVARHHQPELFHARRQCQHLWRQPATITPSFDYGGSVGNTQYFFTGRGNWNNLGIENPTSSLNALHDHTEQGKFFAYVSTAAQRFNPSERDFRRVLQRVPDSQQSEPDAARRFRPANLQLVEPQRKRGSTSIYFNIVALQTKGDVIDTQFSVFSRYAKVHFVPDVSGDLVFNNVASDVTRASQMYGTQFDASYELNAPTRCGRLHGDRREDQRHQRRRPCCPSIRRPRRYSPTPFTVTMPIRCWAGISATYVQDEWKLTNQLTLNYGIRFDQLYQFVNANQFSPRAALVYKPFDGTTLPCRLRPLFHAADAGAGDPGEPRAVQQHHEPAGRCR